MDSALYDAVNGLKMDVYRPVAMLPQVKYPLIVLMHGGGFITGKRSDLAYLCEEFASRGMIAATIDYRLGWNTGPDSDPIQDCEGDKCSTLQALYRAMQDAHKAVAFLVQPQFATYLDVTRIYIGGQSAGSIAALHTAFATQAEIGQYAANLSGCPSSLFENMGPLAPNRTYTFKGVFDGWGAILDLDMIDQNETANVISFHSLNDNVVPCIHGYFTNCDKYLFVHGSQEVYERRNSQGICSELFVDLDGQHTTAFLELVPNDLGARAKWMAQRAVCFFRSALCDPQTCTYFPTVPIQNCIATDCDTCTTAACSRDSMDARFPYCGPASQSNSMATVWPASEEVPTLKVPAGVLHYEGDLKNGGRIMDAEGRCVMDVAKCPTQPCTIAVNSLRPGLYHLIDLSTSGPRKIQRFVVVGQ